jgi:hypothetical protein
MAEPNVTLATLRRAIAKELNMRFFKRYKNGYLDADSGDADSLIDAALTQKDKFWNGSWIYRVASQEVSLITNFNTSTNELSLEVPVTTFASGDDYEIHDLWNAYDIHEAINQAIRDVRRIFIETITDETIIIEEDKLAYSLSSLARTPFMIHKVWIEQPASVRRHVAAGGTFSELTTNNNGELQGIMNGWLISIYGGYGAGQLRTVSAATGTSIIPTVQWTEIPDDTSKWAAWDPNEQINDWYPWSALRYDSTKEFPDVLYFSRRPVDFEGLRIRLEYSAYPEELTAEDDTTPIPQSYLVPAAVAKLHGKKVGDTKVDRELHFAESRRYAEIADAWLIRNAPHKPDTNVLKQHSGAYQPDSMNPLNWG